MGAFEKFIAGKAFIYVAAAYFLFMWLLKLELIGIAGGILFICYILITQKDITPLLPVVTLFITGISLTQLPAEFIPDVYPVTFYNSGINISLSQCYVFVGIFAAMLMGSIIFHLIKYRHEKSEDRYPVYKPFFAAIAAMLLGGLFSNERHTLFSQLVSLLYVFLLVFFVICANVKPIGDKKEYFASLSIAYAAVLSVEMLVFYVNQGNIIDALIYKSLFLGWGVGNTLAPILVIAVPMALYLYAKKQKLIFLAAAFVFFIATLFTVCRGEIFLLVLAAPFLAVLTLKWSKKKLEPLFAALAFVGLCVLSYFTFKEFFADFLDRISYFSNSGRTPIRVEFSKFFARNPVFGIGYIIFKDGRPILAMPHMLVTNILSSTGIAGFFAFAYFYHSIFKAVFIYKSRYNMFLFFSLALVVGYAFADPKFYEIPLYLSLFPLIQGARRDTDAPRYKIWNKIKELTDASAVNSLIVFLAGIISAAALFAVAAFTGYEKFLFGKETFSYISTAALFLVSCAILPYSAPKVFKLIKNKIIKQK